VEGQPHGHIYAELIINGKPLQAMLDIGANTVYMATKLADEVGLSYTKEKGFVKGINTRRQNIKFLSICSLNAYYSLPQLNTNSSLNF